LTPPLTPPTAPAWKQELRHDTPAEQPGDESKKSE